jgi:lysophospholipase L1-like esterase
MGWGVADEDTFSAELERRLHGQFPERDLDVVNISVGGYDTFQEVGLLRRNVTRLEPDLVLVGFYTNDVPDALDHEDPATDGRTRIDSVDASAGKILHMNPAPSTWWERAMRRSRAAYVLGRGVKGLTGKSEQAGSRFAMEIDILQGKDSTDLEHGWALVSRQFQELRELAASRFAVGVVVLPCREQVEGRYPNAKYQSRIRAIADRFGFFVVNPLPALVSSGRRAADLFIPYDRNHPSAAGHRLIGDSIFDYLKEHDRTVPIADSHGSFSGGELK